MSNEELEYTAYLIDGFEYVIAKVVEYNNDNYCFLVNTSDPKDSFIKKYVNGNLSPVTKAEDLVNVILKICSKGV